MQSSVINATGPRRHWVPGSREEASTWSRGAGHGVPKMGVLQPGPKERAGRWESLELRALPWKSMEV